ncbi:hypothetical protein Goari_006633, partial [Gossypium aridum]|nr:hypothetical protein [Gossypium aridum]
SNLTATVSNLIATAIFNLTGAKHTAVWELRWEPITLDVNGVGTPKPQIIWAIEEDKRTHVNFKALNDIFNSMDPHEFTEYENTNYL